MYKGAQGAINLNPPARRAHVARQRARAAARRAARSARATRAKTKQNPKASQQYNAKHKHATNAMAPSMRAQKSCVRAAQTRAYGHVSRSNVKNVEGNSKVLPSSSACQKCARKCVRAQCAAFVMHAARGKENPQYPRKRGYAENVCLFWRSWQHNRTTTVCVGEKEGS